MLRGLPSNGQRTWSNASTSKTCNRFLQRHKLGLSKLFFSGVDSNELLLASSAEQINMLWRRQWYREWLYSRSSIRRQLRGRRGSFRLDLTATAAGWLGDLRRDNPKLGKKKKKMLTGSIGFDPGFTRVYLLFKDKQPRPR